MMDDSLNEFLKDYRFDLDPALIASYPCKNRDESRLMLVDAKTGSIDIQPYFHELINFLQPQDLMVFNSTRVEKRRVYLYTAIGRRHEALFLKPLPSGQDWQVMLRRPGKINNEQKLMARGSDIFFHLVERREKISILRSNRLVTEEDFDRMGCMPIPPYLKREAEELDNTRYQTVFARQPGSIAAPTAGLHFSERLLQDLQAKGIDSTELNLQVGYGTFSPIELEQWQQKKLHKEEYELSEETANQLNSARSSNKRIIAVGTTSLRALEASYNFAQQKFIMGKKDTELFITPGDRIHTANGLITNFHLPGSSLLLLVAAFAGKELILEAYQQAIRNRMRFFSYGDAMLIWRV